MSDALKQLQNTLKTFSLKEGKNTTRLPYLNIHRFTAKNIRMPNTARPYLYLIAEGMLRLHTVSGILDYVPGQYSLSTIDSPQSGQFLTAGGDSQFVAVEVDLSIDDALSVMLEMDDKATERIINSQISERVMADFDTSLVAAVDKLLRSTNHPETLTFMGRHLRREIIFDIISGCCGKEFLQSIINLQDAGEIYSINNWIKENYKDSFSVEELARRLNMSISSFHKKFKCVVGMGPLQCQKRLRLTEARRLMLDEDKKVADAAMEVGYESISQFTRDYSRMFGYSPKNDIMQLRKKLNGSRRD